MVKILILYIISHIFVCSNLINDTTTIILIFNKLNYTNNKNSNKPINHKLILSNIDPKSLFFSWLEYLLGVFIPGIFFQLILSFTENKSEPLWSNLNDYILALDLSVLLWEV